MIRKENSSEWVSDSKRANKQLFSELDVLLRALDRFFIPDNFGYTPEELTSRNFSGELAVARDSVLRILGVLEVIIPESRKNAYWFQKFAETKLLSAGKRDAFRESLYRQDTPEKGLYHLYDSFNNLKGVISDLVRTDDISYMGFMNIGRLLSKGVRENKFFNPFRRALNPDFDMIRNSIISEAVKAIPSNEIRKSISVIYIYLFRFLRFMDFVDIETLRPVSLNASLLILVLLRSEITILQSYIAKVLGRIEGQEIEGVLRSIDYQFAMETRRVYQQELRGIYLKNNSPRFRGMIENSRGILMNLTEQTIVQLTRCIRPETDGREIFPGFITKMNQSIRMREEICALIKLLDIVGKTAADQKKSAKAFESLKKYMNYFENSTFRLLRHDDYEEFSRFFSEVNSPGKMEIGPLFAKTSRSIAQFRIYLETILRNVENRSELTDRTLDTGKVDALVSRYI